MMLRVIFIGVAVAVSVDPNLGATQQLFGVPQPLGEDVRGSLSIFHGRPTTIKKHPYMVSLHSDGVFVCAGAIISDSWVVTAAQCVYNWDISTASIVAGAETSSGGAGQVFSVVRNVTHPQYVDGNLDYDYACVQINGKFPQTDSIKPVRLPQQGVKAGTNVIVVGWGATSNKKAFPGQLSGGLLQGKMKWISRSACQSAYQASSITWTDRIACAYNKGKTTMCSGDLSDPFVHNGVLYGLFIGIDSTGSCSPSAKPAILADIHTATSWILDTIRC